MIQSGEDMQQRLAAVRLPAMPQILLKLLELCQADGAGMAELAKLVGNDAAMAVKILDLANSAALQRGGPKTSLQQALSHLGLDMVKALVISESVFQTVGSFAALAQTDLRRFWRHALSTAVMAREIARSMDYAQPEEAYLAGLLHDVGRLALLAAAPDDYAPHFQAEDDAALCATELRLLHTTHMEAGAWVVERWQLDSFLADATLYHHESTARLEGAHPLVRLVHLAQELSLHAEQPTSPGVAPQPLPAGLGALCGIAEPALQAISQAAKSQVQKAATFLGLDLSGIDQPPGGAGAAPPAPTVAQAAQLRLGDEVRDRALLAELGQALAAAGDDAQLMRLVRRQARVLFGLERVAVFLLRSGSQTLLGASVPEPLQRLQDLAIPLTAGSAMAEALRQNQVAFLERRGKPFSVVEEQLLRAFGSAQLLCIPMLQGQRCLGALLAALPPGMQDALRPRERMLLAFAAQAAAALHLRASAPGPTVATPVDAQAQQAELSQRLEAAHQEHRAQARRVVHEVNNPLAIIKNYLEVLDDKLIRQEPVQGEIGLLHEEIDRIGVIMGGLVGSAPPPTQGNRADINQTVRRVAQLLRESRFLPATLVLEVQLPAQACLIEGSADALKQILVNLLKNAVEAMPRGGRIEVVNNGPVQRNGRTYYALSVSDDGPGIPPEHRSKLFAPVQSRKAGSNRGIGLSIVQSLVKQLGGTIACVSSSSQGTMFEICLPVPADLPMHALEVT